MASDETYMRRCLELAVQGLGSVSPNPMVGCVIVRKGQIIGEGYHKNYGGPHAEVNALNSVTDKSLIPGSTVYVSLEPCSHYGQTPPCSLALIENKVGKVVIACTDPFEKVSGNGIRMLTDKGIDVKTGILEAEAVELNKRFFTVQIKKRPYVFLKWAQSADGYIAPEKSDGIHWISNEKARIFSHQLRANEDAILIGKNTLIHDNPSLTTRFVKGSDPVRFVLDSRLETISDAYTVYSDSGKTYVINALRSDEQSNPRLLKSDMTAGDILNRLSELRIQSVIIEGGRMILDSFLKAELWDEAWVITGDQNLNDGIPAPQLPENMVSEESQLDNNLIQHYIHD